MFLISAKKQDYYFFFNFEFMLNIRQALHCVGIPLSVPQQKSNPLLNEFPISLMVQLDLGTTLQSSAFFLIYYRQLTVPAFLFFYLIRNRLEVEVHRQHKKVKWTWVSDTFVTMLRKSQEEQQIKSTYQVGKYYVMYYVTK